jgi:hypothetical protein
MWEKQRTSTFSRHRRVKRPSFNLLCLSLILRRLDEIERKLDHVLEELRTPTAIGYSARRGNRPRKD